MPAEKLKAILDRHRPAMSWNMDILDLSDPVYKDIEDIEMQYRTAGNIPYVPQGVKIILLGGYGSKELPDLSQCKELTSIHIAESDTITALSKLPPSIKNFSTLCCKGMKSVNLDGCINLKTLILKESAITEFGDNYLPSLTKLELQYSRDLKSVNLSKFPNLQEVNLSGCCSLEETPELLAQLDVIENNNPYKVQRPKHWPEKGIEQEPPKASVKGAIAGAVSNVSRGGGRGGDDQSRSHDRDYDSASGTS